MSTRSDDGGGDFWGDVDDALALERYRTLVDVLDDGIYQLDADGRFVAVNDVIVELTGYDRQELLGSHVSLLLEDTDIERIEREIAGGLAEDPDDIPAFELGVRAADGGTISCELRLTLLVEDDTFEGTIGIARPTRDRGTPVTTLPSAQSTHDSITAVLEQADVGVFVLDADARVAWANETIGEYFGFDLDSVLGRDKRALVDEVIADVVDEPEEFAATVTATYDGDSYVEQFECHVRPGEGRQERWLEHRSEPIESGAYAGGRVELYYDITDRKHVQRAHRADREQFESLVDATEEHAIFLLDPAGHVVTWNAGASGVIGYEADEIVGEHVSTFYTEDAREARAPEANLAAAARDGSAAEEDWRVRADGSLFWANVTISAIRDDDGDLEGFAKVVHDMTDRKRARAERELLYETTRSIAEAESFEAGLRAALRDICSVTDWDYAEAWLPTDDGRLRRAAPDYHDEDLAAFAAFSEGYTFEIGEGLPGRVFDSGEPEWVTDLASTPAETFPRADVAVEAGLRSGLSVPVRAGEEVVGVLTFGMRRVKESDEDQVDLVSSVAAELGDLVTRRRAEERHRRERELTDRVFETAPIGIAVFGPDRTLQRANDRLYAVLEDTFDADGYEAGDVPLYDEAGELIPEGDRPINVAFETGEAVFDRTVQLELPDGTTRWLSVNATPLTDADGEVTEVVATATDVSQLKEQAERLQRRREALESELDDVFARVDDAFYAVDEAFRFTYVNDRAAELLQRSEEELLGERLWDVFPSAAELDAVWEAFHTARDEQEPTDYEIYYDTLDFWVEANLYPSESGISVYFRDVTERKEREARRTEMMRELQEREERLRLALRAADLGTWELDLRTMEATHHTTRHDQIFGYDESLEEWSYETFLEHVQPEDRERVERSFEDGLETGKWDVECRIERVDGEQRVIVAHGEVGYENGEAVRARGTIQDVTERRERERQLEEYRQWNQTLMEHFPNGAVALVDRDLQYVTFGGTPEGDTVVTREDLEGEPIREALPEQIAEVVVPRYEAALEGEPSEFEDTIDGHTYQFHFVPVRDDDGAVFAAAAMSQDVTEQKEREEQLRDAKLQLEAATEAGAVGTWEWHVQEDEFVAGASFAKTFGVDPEAAREGVSIDRLMDSIHAADRDRVAEEIEAAIERCGEYEAEYRVWNADDELRWVVARGHVECDADGVAETFPGALTDITERKRAELELDRQRRELETLFEVLPVGVVVADADGSLLRANDTAREIWGGDVFDADSPADYEKFTAWWADSGEPVGPGEWTMEQVLDGEAVTEPNVYDIKAFDGRRRIIMEHGMPVREADGSVTRAVVTLTDISERKAYERQLEESNERLEQFAYAASHDLQEPLRMVTSYLQLVERRYADELDEDAEEFIEFAVDGADRMREMIDGLLQYSRVETRGDPFEPVDLEDVLADVREDLQVRIEETDAEITSEDLPRVEGDASQLRQVFQNLLDNAIEYRGDEPPAIHVDAERIGNRWRVSVTDEGIGIDPDDADRVFDVFQRLHTNAEHPGTGIGLALCKRIVERHGGDIQVDSEPGEGATFTFTLPAADDATSE